MPLNFTYILQPLSAFYRGVFKMARKISVLTDLNRIGRTLAALSIFL